MNWEVWITTGINAILLFILGIIVKNYLKDSKEVVKGLGSKFKDLTKEFESMKKSVDWVVNNEVRLMNQTMAKFEKELWGHLRDMNNTIHENTLIMKRRKSEMMELTTRYEKRDEEYKKVFLSHKKSIQILDKNLNLEKTKVEKIGKDLILLKTDKGVRDEGS